MHLDFPRTHFVRTVHIPNEVNNALTNRQSGLNVLYIVIALNSFILVCNVISVLVQLVKFAMLDVALFVTLN